MNGTHTHAYSVWFGFDEMETLKHNENSHIHHSTQLMTKKMENKFAFSAFWLKQMCKPQQKVCQAMCVWADTERKQLRESKR